MSNLPGNPFAEGPDNYRETLHYIGKSHLAYEISATLALAYEQRTANLLKVLELQGRMHIAEHAFNLSAFDVAPRLGLGDTK